MVGANMVSDEFRATDFQFYPTNHSVVRAEYHSPCIPYELTGRDKVGFFSGYHPVDAILDNASDGSLARETSVN